MCRLIGKFKGYNVVAFLLYVLKPLIKMTKSIWSIRPGVFVLLTTLFEVSGDAIVRKCIYDYEGITRALFFIIGAILLFCYGFFLN
jgi:hypothetical protein